MVGAGETGYLIVTGLLVAREVAFLDRANTWFTGVLIKREFRIDNARLGWVFSVFLLGCTA